MKIPHKKIFSQIAERFNYSYHQGEGGFEPKNFHYFMDNNGDYALIIEIIPRGKYFPTVYVQLHRGARAIEETLCDYIQNKYQECTIGQGASWAMVFNISRSGLLF